MSRRAGSAARIAVTAAVLAVAPATTATAVTTSGPCPYDDDGVTVVVDASALGGDVSVACATGDPASGLAALTAVGARVDVVASLPGFVCRIDGRPADQSCTTTPPADAYWAYWTAERGGDWTYARVGAAVRDPAPGDVEGWRFATGTDGTSTPPGAAPPGRTGPSPEPTPTTEPTPGSSPAPTTGSSPTPAPSPTATTEPSAAPSPEPSVTSSNEPVPSPDPVTDADAPGEPTTDVPPNDGTTGDTGSVDDAAAGPDAGVLGAPADDDTGGSPVPTLVGLGVVGAVGAVALTAARRR